mmetsp:Transcript_39109/g.103027  ORF Transcript_39109/g.103027 Transcript_39109/m.103027 type:complete len:245 (+) Transcript_39109:2038-2772(+)
MNGMIGRRKYLWRIAPDMMRSGGAPANESLASGSGSGGGTNSSSSSSKNRSSRANATVDPYSLGAAMLAVALGTLGLSYASVPLYRIFCQTTGFGGTTKRHTGGGEEEGYDLPEDPASLPGNRQLRVTFNTDVSENLPWSFKPVQKHVTVLAGQTALAFFEATNHSDEPIIGVATYNVVPNEAGAYFNKIQCFCFDEQRLLPGETVDMPVFFYIDPDFLNDRRMKRLDTMTLSYTFFRSNEIYE